MDLALAARTALVCASTSGLGLATARALAEDGATVVVTSRSAERAKEVAATLPKAVGIGCDLVSEDGADALIAAATDHVGGIDILVLNGPGPAPGLAADTDIAGIDAAVATLVKPQVQLVRSVLPKMGSQQCGSPIAQSGVVELGSCGADRIPEDPCYRGCRAGDYGQFALAGPDRHTTGPSGR